MKRIFCLLLAALLALPALAACETIVTVKKLTVYNDT